MKVDGYACWDDLPSTTQLELLVYDEGRSFDEYNFQIQLAGANIAKAKPKS